MFTLDTNTIIYYAAGDAKIVSFLRENRNKIFYLPSIVAVEFLSHPLIDRQTITKFRLFISQTTSISLDIVLAELAAEIRRIYQVKLADAVIAATAIFTRSSLLTRNVRDFRKIKELKIIRV